MSGVSGRQEGARDGGRDGRDGRAESGGMAAKKLEPHTEMWGTTQHNHSTRPQHTQPHHNHNTQTQPQQRKHNNIIACVCGILRGRWSQGSAFGRQLETLATPRRDAKITIPSPRTHKQNRKPQNSRPWQHAPQPPRHENA